MYIYIYIHVCLYIYMYVYYHIGKEILRLLQCDGFGFLFYITIFFSSFGYSTFVDVSTGFYCLSTYPCSRPLILYRRFHSFRWCYSRASLHTIYNHLAIIHRVFTWIYKIKKRIYFVFFFCFCIDKDMFFSFYLLYLDILS